MESIYKVDKSDLIGEIEDFPCEVVNKMIEEQVKQGNLPDVRVFQSFAIAGQDENGFDWNITTDGCDFWEEVIAMGNFELFFTKYPKQVNNNIYIVSDGKCGKYIIDTLCQLGGVNFHQYSGNNKNDTYFIDPVTKNIEVCSEEDGIIYNMVTTFYTKVEIKKPIVELTMKEIADKFGVDIECLRIKE